MLDINKNIINDDILGLIKLDNYKVDGLDIEEDYHGFEENNSAIHNDNISKDLLDQYKDEIDHIILAKTEEAIKNGILKVSESPVSIDQEALEQFIECEVLRNAKILTGTFVTRCDIKEIIYKIINYIKLLQDEIKKLESQIKSKK